MKKSNHIIAGFLKSRTASPNQFLYEYPEIYMPVQNELHIFIKIIFHQITLKQTINKLIKTMGSLKITTLKIAVDFSNRTKKTDYETLNIDTSKM